MRHGRRRLQETRRLYAIVHELQPFASQGWLEHAKMEEECGDMLECQSLLARGLAHCPPVASESLVIRSLRCEERLGNLANARALLHGLIHEPVTRVWRAILEGANMEARVGCLSVAREIFKVCFVCGTRACVRLRGGLSLSLCVCVRVCLRRARVCTNFSWVYHRASRCTTHTYTRVCSS